jgi:hypothetical protein
MDETSDFTPLVMGPIPVPAGEILLMGLLFLLVIFLFDEAFKK